MVAEGDPKFQVVTIATFHKINMVIIIMNE